MNVLKNSFYTLGLGVFLLTIFSCGEPPVDLQQALNDGDTPLSLLNSGEEVSDFYGLIYEGGMIFHLTENGTGLVAAPDPINVTTEWGCSSGLFDAKFAGATGVSVGTGASNTQIIVDSCMEANTAAKFCDAFAVNGHSDWFLPSKDELSLIYDNLFRNLNVAFAEGTYYTSSEEDIESVWVQVFNEDITDPVLQLKSEEFNFHPVRAF